MVHNLEFEIRRDDPAQESRRHPWQNRNRAAVLQYPIGACRPEISLFARGREGNHTCSSCFPGSDTCRNIFYDHTVAGGKSENRSSFEIGLGVRFTVGYIGRRDEVVRYGQTGGTQTHFGQCTRRGRYRLSNDWWEGYSADQGRQAGAVLRPDPRSPCVRRFCSRLRDPHWAGSLARWTCWVARVLGRRLLRDRSCVR